MHYISLFCLVTNVQISHGVLLQKSFIIPKTKNSVQRQNNVIDENDIFAPLNKMALQNFYILPIVSPLSK
jgi:hypothetical protein